MQTSAKAAIASYILLKHDSALKLILVVKYIPKQFENSTKMLEANSSTMAEVSISIRLYSGSIQNSRMSKKTQDETGMLTDWFTLSNNMSADVYYGHSLSGEIQLIIDFGWFLQTPSSVSYCVVKAVKVQEPAGVSSNQVVICIHLAEVVIISVLVARIQVCILKNGNYFNLNDSSS